jgi:hypothetical protein
MTVVLKKQGLMVTFPSAIAGNGHSYFAEFEKCLSADQVSRKRLQKAFDKGPTQFREAARAHLNSRATKVIASFNSYTHRYPNKPAPLQKTFAVADNPDWGKAACEPVVCDFVPKSSGGQRLICNFGPLRRSMAYQLKPVLEILLGHSHRPFQYFFKGYYRAVMKAKELMQAGYDFSCELDIRECFPSIEVSKLGKLLSLQNGAVERACAFGDAHATWRIDGAEVPSTVLTEKVRLSLPQGLPISSLIAEIIISKLGWAVPPGIELINFADNFLVLGKSKSEVASAADTLRAAIHALAGGSFLTKSTGVVALEDGAGFLGHDFQKVGEDVLVRALAENEMYAMLERYEEELFSSCSTKKAFLGTQKKALRVLGKMLAYFTSWAAAFKACDNIHEHHAAFQITFESLCSQFGFVATAAFPYYDASAEYYYNGYS